MMVTDIASIVTVTMDTETTDTMVIDTVVIIAETVAIMARKGRDAMLREMMAAIGMDGTRAGSPRGAFLGLTSASISTISMRRTTASQISHLVR